MLATVKLWAHEALLTFVRVALIFMVLSIGLDSLTRIYYSYMPITTWMKFESVEVVQRDEPYVILTRYPVGSSISLFHRTLLIRYPDERRGCGASTTAVLDDTSVAQVVVPLDHMLSAACPDVIGTMKTNAVLQVSYIFDFPYGVKRSIIKSSSKFSISYDGTNYHVGPPLTDAQLAASR